MKETRREREEIKRDRDEERREREEGEDEREKKRERHYEKRVEKCLRTHQIRLTYYLIMILKKTLSDELFVQVFRILPVFSVIHLIRIRIFGPREIIQN